MESQDDVCIFPRQCQCPELVDVVPTVGADDELALGLGGPDIPYKVGREGIPLCRVGSHGLVQQLKCHQIVWIGTQFLCQNLPLFPEFFLFGEFQPQAPGSFVARCRRVDCLVGVGA